MSKYSNEEILKALKVIQDICYESGNGPCRECPLRNGDDGCAILERTDGGSYASPREWDFFEPEKRPRLILN